jgi:NADPH:quinone reductase
MKVIGVTEFGGPEALAVHEAPTPSAGPGEVRIRVHAVAINPTDTTTRAGYANLSHKEPPYVPGMDAAGVVDEVGEGSEFSVGDEVMTMTIPGGENGGAYAQYLVAPDDAVTRIPSGVTIQQAATLPMNGQTALQALEKLGLEPGQTLAVTGAAGTLGQYSVRLAKKAGLTVVADSADKDRELVESAGPDHIVPRGDDVAQQIREIFPDGVDGLIDAAVMDEKAVPAVRDGGAFVSVRFWKGTGERDINFRRAAVVAEYHSRAKLDFLRSAVEDGTLELTVADVYPPEKAAEAHTRFEQGGVRGRLILDLSAWKD